MTDNKPSKLLVSRAEASEKIRRRIDIGIKLYETEISAGQGLDKLMRDARKWTDYNIILFDSLFDESPLAEDHGLVIVFPTGVGYHKRDMSHWITDLESVYESLELYEELPNSTQQPMNNDAVNNENKKIFIGHGRSHEWLKLQIFLQNKLKLPYEEFNRIPQAGNTTSDRLKKMLESCCIAFLIMTGEDEHKDGTLHARENVIHEIGLFQAQLGYERAIILLEDGCKDFSNIHGVTHIPFPKENIKAAFEEIRGVLKRERIIKQTL